MTRFCNALKALIILAAATAGGWAADRMGMPLAWIIGALVVSTGFAFAGVRVNFHGIRQYGLVVLGLALGQSFTPAILVQIAAVLPVILACGLATLATGLPVARLFTRMAGVDPNTAFFCAVPGGVVLMAVQAHRAGASEPQVVLAQTVRLVIVVLIYPVLISWFVPDHAQAADAAALRAAWVPADMLGLGLFLLGGVVIAHLGRRSFLPNPWMIGPCLFAIALIGVGWAPAPLPHELVILCQVILGVSLGSQMTPDFVLGSRRLLAVSVLSSLLLTLILVPAALIVAGVMDLPAGAVLLGMAPGGMPEMTVAAKAIGTAVPLVLSFHLTRILIGNLLIEPFWWMARRRGWAGTASPAPRDTAGE